MEKIPFYNKQIILRNKSNLLKLLKTIILGAFALIWITPFLWMLSTSFKRNTDIFNYPIDWIPAAPILENYHEVWFGRYPFLTFYLNSLFVTGITVIGAVIISSMAAYAFARMKFPGRDVIFILFLATMMIPTQVTLIPRFILFNSLGILNSHTALILPGLFNIFCTFLMRQFYLQVPFALSEAARIDGAGEFRVWFQIIMPLTKPALVTMIVLIFTWTWNDYENPLIFLTSEKLFTIPLGLNKFIDEYGTQFGPMMAAATCSLLPMFLIFMFGQKYFVEGVASSGVKG